MGYIFPARRKARKLDQLGFVARGRSRHRPRNEPSLYGGEYPFFQTGDIRAANLYLSEYSQTYNEKGLAQSKQWEPGTLCITIAANIADTAILGIRGCFPDSVIGFMADPTEADVRFIKYYIDLIKLDMKQVSHGTTQDNLSLDKLLRFDFVVPDIEEQRKIAAILTAYDDLIENNLRRIKILEDMAQLAYSEWFVRFRYPGHNEFDMVESERRPIPKGWEVKQFSEIAQFTNGFAFTPRQWGHSGKPIIKIAELKNGVTSKTPFYGGHDIPQKYQVRNGDVLFSWSADLDVYVWGGGDALLNQHLFNVRPRGQNMKFFLFHSLKEHMQEFRDRSQGTTMRHIKRSALDQVEVIVPPPKKMGLFEGLVTPVFEMVISLKSRNAELQRIRDLLLPRLISGEVDIAHIVTDLPLEQ
jgi:type I restriction enzyme S subunit